MCDGWNFFTNLAKDVEKSVYNQQQSAGEKTASSRRNMLAGAPVF